MARRSGIVNKEIDHGSNQPKTVENHRLGDGAHRRPQYRRTGAHRDESSRTMWRLPRPDSTRLAFTRSWFFRLQGRSLPPCGCVLTAPDKPIRITKIALLSQIVIRKLHVHVRDRYRALTRIARSRSSGNKLPAINRATRHPPTTNGRFDNRWWGAAGNDDRMLTARPRPSNT